MNWMNFFGTRMQQHPTAILRLSRFLQTRKPKRIIEIGTGAGGLAVLIAGHCFERIDFHTIDIERSPEHRKLKALGACVHVGDFWTVLNWFKKLIAREGQTIIFCDGGNKKQEVASLWSAMKPEDLILAHDYAVKTSCDFSLWPHREITDRHLAGLPLDAMRLVDADPIYEELRMIGWGCWRLDR